MIMSKTQLQNDHVSSRISSFCSFLMVNIKSDVENWGKYDLKYIKSSVCMLL